MFEELALAYVGQSVFAIKAISFGLIILGAFIAGATFDPAKRVTRSAFFAGTALAILAMQVAQMVWFDVYLAVDSGYLISLVIAELLISILAGILLGQLAIGRSRDAYGTGRWAFLAFIPIAAFWLFFTSGRETGDAEQVSRLRTGVLVALGFAAFISGTISNLWIRGQMAEIVSERTVAREATPS